MKKIKNNRRQEKKINISKMINNFVYAKKLSVWLKNKSSTIKTTSTNA